MYLLILGNTNSHFKLFYFILFYLFLEKGEGEREGKKHQYVIASHMPPTEDVAHNPDMCPD